MTRRLIAWRHEGTSSNSACPAAPMSRSHRGGKAVTISRDAGRPPRKYYRLLARSAAHVAHAEERFPFSPVTMDGLDAEVGG